MVIIGLFAILLFSIVLYSPQQPPHSMETAVDPASSSALVPAPVQYVQQVKPILERRCVVCHGCYDSPCQLKLSSIEGLRRGASEERIYDPNRITNMTPTRLFVDAKTTQQWRTRGFTAVINEGEQGPEKNLDNSVLYHLLRLKQQHPQPNQGQLPESFTLGLNREESCPTLETIDEFSQKNPLWGMPYAMPNLSKQEHQTLVSWLAQGAHAPPQPGPSSTVSPQIKRWEIFLNQPSNKQRLVSRYLYEHLFHAHIHFSASPEREFYRLVRSTTPPGQLIDEIPTLRPYDDPGSAPFYYRLLKYQPAIVAKNHIVYPFSDERMARYRELFLLPDYEVDQLPSYDPQITTNPFKVFGALPAESRYRFLLDDAYFFIEGFIKGPVCRGQIALDVIEDRFWVMFFDPNQPVITNNAQFIGEMADDLQVPAEDGGGNFELFRIWTDYWKGQRRYMESKQAWFKTIGTHELSQAMDYIWDGGGTNPNAALTVFRHFDSGSVAYGLVGDNPETTWIIDYPLFERIHYLLVAGFNVYGNLSHRMSTRIYMDFLRMEGEDSFLAFLPASKRKTIRDTWYMGQRATVEELFSAPQAWLSTESVVGYQTDDPQRELYQHFKSRLTGATQRADTLNRCGPLNNCTSSEQTQKRAAHAMQSIAQLTGEKLHAFPDVAFVRIRTGKTEEDLAYTLIRNKAYKNVTSFLADERERDRADIDKDSMTVVNWLEGSYPNFFFSVALSEIETFTKRCAAIRNSEEYKQFVDQYGVRRTHPEFWALADWFQDKYARDNPISSGLFDLNRYHNR